MNRRQFLTTTAAALAAAALPFTVAAKPLGVVGATELSIADPLLGLRSGEWIHVTLQSDGTWRTVPVGADEGDLISGYCRRS